MAITLTEKAAKHVANYIAKRLDPHFPVLYKNHNGRVAHECIVDPRAFKDSVGVTVDDLAALSISTDSAAQVADGLNAFFRTPVGQRFADKQPLVAQRSAVAMQSVMATLIPRMQAAMQSLLQEAGVQ